MNWFKLGINLEKNQAQKLNLILNIIRPLL
jgi:hypothetical protein